MRVLLFDIDTLRADHLGCYGYERPTSPNIDSLSEDAMKFENYYCSDAPCLPSRAALVTGQFGIHNGVVGHGGTAAELRPLGAGRGMFDQRMMQSLFWQFRNSGMHTASISTFSERHSAYWFNAGLNEVINVGKFGDERADEVAKEALSWIDGHKDEDNWFLHVHFWDPHTPYRTPDEMGDPFEDMPKPQWITDEVFKEHLKHVGPHSLNELNGFEVAAPPHWTQFKKHPGKATTPAEHKKLLDLYDCGILYMDFYVGKIIEKLKEQGIYEDMAVILTSDHGENMGELGIYAEHGSADEPTCHIPMLMKWPGMSPGIDTAFRYNIDFLPTVADLLGNKMNPLWDGKSYAGLVEGKHVPGYEYLVLSQCAHVCQRSVRFDHYYYIRTYHDGMHEFPVEMLFDLDNDFHEQHNLADERPDLCGTACRYLLNWEQIQMTKGNSQIDPLWTVMKEGGPFHAKCNGQKYYDHLVETGRSEGAKRFKERHPEVF